ncbi:MAG: hypothetical protein ACYDHH_01445 [Solirubrobacteraceae bacterium]
MAPRSRLNVARAALATAVATAAAVAAAAAAAAPIAAASAVTRFTITYTGSGRVATSYHSTPPNVGGNADTNFAHDSSTQAWKLRFDQQLMQAPARLRLAGPAMARST